MSHPCKILSKHEISTFFQHFAAVVNINYVSTFCPIQNMIKFRLGLDGACQVITKYGNGKVQHSIFFVNAEVAWLQMTKVPPKTIANLPYNLSRNLSLCYFNFSFSIDGGL